MLYLPIDLGTSAVKLSVVNDEMQVLGWSQAEYAYLLLPGEKAELREADLWHALFDAASKLDPGMRRRVDVLCYDTFSPSPVLMDGDGALIYPNIITHLDRRSRPQSAVIERLVGRDAYLHTAGIYPFAGGCSAMTLLWFAEHMPETLNKTQHIGHLTTYLHQKLTGKWMVDLVNASMLGVYETTTQNGWSDMLIRALGFKRGWFDEIKNPGELFGTLLPGLADRLGLRAGIPVTVGTNDIAAAHMGAGNTVSGCMMNAAGSSEMISILTNKPVTNPGYYLRNAALPGLWQIYVTTCGGFAVDWFYRQFCREMTKPDFYAYLSTAISESNDDEIAFAPYLSGDRQSLERRTAAWTGLTLRATREEMLAAMLRSMQGVLSEAISEARSIIPLSDTIRVSGGMATPAYLKLKSAFFPSFRLEIVNDCPILGNVALAKRGMQGETK